MNRTADRTDAAQRQYISAEVRGIDKISRSVTGYVCTRSIDRHGTIIEPEAFRDSLEAFTKNPVLVASHTYQRDDGEPTAVGRWTDLRITPEGLIGTAVFSTTPLAERWWTLYADQSVRAFSIGFDIQQQERRNVNVAGQNRIVPVITKAELIEISTVVIPSNRDSLVMAARMMGAEVRFFDDDADHAAATDAGHGGPVELSNRRAMKVMRRVVAEAVREEFKAQFSGSEESAIRALIEDTVATFLRQRRIAECYGDHSSPAGGGPEIDTDSEIVGDLGDMTLAELATLRGESGEDRAQPHRAGAATRRRGAAAPAMVKDKW